VLDLSRVETGRISVSIEPVSLPAILDEVLTTLEAMAARQGISIRSLPLTAALPDVLADRTRLKQILMNYGSNAIKYGVRGGHAEFDAHCDGELVRIAVRDDGIGVPKDKQDKLFQPFQRAGQEAGPIEGTGIGLAISKRLAELMRGNVGFESTSGRGSVFWIELPAARVMAQPPQASTGHGSEAQRLRDPDGPHFAIVYIEDNPSNIAFMEDFVADYERIELTTAPSAEIGIELVRARRPDVVIMDLNLPGMNGIDATHQLRAWPETRDIPVIGLSAAAMMRDTPRVSSAGFYRYLTKPVHVEELSRTLDELLTAAPERPRSARD
jgi:CheY-like chemotaxis protein